jgi:four helix bundle protein
MVSSGGVEDLRVFQLAYSLSLELHRSSLSWPKNEQYGGIADQIRRSSKSACALLMEGHGRRGSSAAEFRRYLVMAIGSADETRLWCRYAEDLGYAAPAQAARWRSSLIEVARMLTGLLHRSPGRERLSPDP